MSDAAIKPLTEIAKPTPSDATPPHVESGAWAPGSQIPKGQRPDLTAAFLSDLVIVGDGFDAVKVASDIQEAMHPGFFSWERGPNTQKVWDTLLNLTPDEYKMVEKEFNQTHAAGDKPLLFAGSEPWTLAKEMRLHLPKDEADRFSMLIESKAHNDVPPAYRVNGEELLKYDSDLKVGETNRVTMSDGRVFDAYIPKNADLRAPVIVAMHGAAGGDSLGLMAQETGLTADAERTGAIIVFAYPKPREFDSSLGEVEGVAWNVPGRKNLPSAVDNQIDDRQYLDNVLDTLGQKAHMSDKVGLYGFSDGGRFAQVYAADRPDRVAGIVSADGTWMKGDKEPTQGKAVMLIHGENDETLPIDGGTGSISSVMDWVLGTNLADSDPRAQAAIWEKANQCKDPDIVDTVGDITTITHQGCTQPLVEYILKDGNHALNDYKNDGNRFMQWLLGSPDLTKNFSYVGADFLKRNILLGQ